MWSFENSSPVQKDAGNSCWFQWCVGPVGAPVTALWQQVEYFSLENHWTAGF